MNELYAVFFLCLRKLIPHLDALYWVYKSKIVNEHKQRKAEEKQRKAEENRGNYRKKKKKKETCGMDLLLYENGLLT